MNITLSSVQSNALLVVLMAGLFSLCRAALMRSAQNCPLPVASPRKLPIRKFSRDGPLRTVSPLKRPVKSKEAGKSKSDTGLVSSFRKLSISPKPHPPPRSKSTSPRKTKSSHVRRLSSFAVSSVEDIANLIKEEKCKNVIVMAGAGISTPSGIPDFRSPGTGLYDNLKQYKIPEPTAIFDLDYFWYDPRPFFCLAKSLYPGNYQPNYVHYFVKLLNDKGLLLRMYTQNIDGLERLAEVPPAKLVEAHGTFSTASCVRCHQSYDGEQIKAAIMSGDIPRCSSPRCSGVIKPDIVFFGEDLPKRFYCYHVDFPKCDLLLIMGTSLEVEPFAGIASAVDRSTPRLLVNREVVGPFSRRWERRSNDVVQTGDVVEGIKKLVDLLGWSDSMDEVVNSAKERWKQPSFTNLSDYKKVSGEVGKDIGNVWKDISANGKNATANEQGITKNPKPPISKNFHSTSSGFTGKGVLYRTDRNLVFRRKGGVMSNTLELHRVPLLPFRYTQRNDMSTEDRSKDFKTIDPGKDLASAGFGLGKRSFGLSCFLAGTSNDSSSSSSDDDN